MSRKYSENAKIWIVNNGTYVMKYWAFSRPNKQHEIKPAKYFQNSQLKGLKTMTKIICSN